MEYIHNIFIVNSFDFGKRVAYDLVEQKNKKRNNENVREFLVKIYKEAGKEVSLTNHTIVTNSAKWISVCQKDSFFDDIKIIKKQEVFIEYIKYNNKLKRNDVLAFVLLMHEKQNIIDADIDDFIEQLNVKYKAKFNKKLFDDFMYIDSKPTFKGKMAQYEDIIFDRIMSSENGYQKIKFIIGELTLRKK